MNRTRSSTKNIIAGLANRLVMVLGEFLIRAIMIRTLGSEYLGLSNLFTSILSMLNIAEMGFGSAMIFSMYKPIAENDKDKLRKLLGFYRKAYHVIGLIILVFGSALTPFLPSLMKGEHPADVNIYFLYFLYLANTVLGYFAFSYKASLFSAHQQDFVRTMIRSVVYVCIYAIQATALILLKNYYVYIIWMPIATLVINLIQAAVSKRMYPDLYPEGKLDKNEVKDIGKRVAGLATYQIAGAIFTNADTLVVSAFLGLATLAKYTNYYYIEYGLNIVLDTISGGMTASIGNSIVTENVEKNAKDFHTINLIFLMMTGVITICLVCLYQPFMTFWMGKSMLLSMENVIFFAVYFYFSNSSRAVGLYKNAAGIWWEDRFRPIVGIVVNITLNLWWVNIWGVNGVLLSSILHSALISLPWATYFLYKLYFKKGYWKYIAEQYIVFAITAIAAFGIYKVCMRVAPENNIVTFLIRLPIVLSLSILLYVIYLIITHQLGMTYSYVKNHISILKNRRNHE